MADLIATCFGGRNRRCGEAFVRTKKPWETIELEELKGQKIAGLPTTKEAYEVIVNSKREKEFPLFVKIHDICFKEASPESLFDIFKTPIKDAGGSTFE